MKDLLDSLDEIDPLLRGAERILIATDFDGTLCPLARSPAYVRVDPATLSVLRILQASDDVPVAIITGRPVSDVRARLPFVTIFAGNHGLEIETGRFRFVHPQAEAAAPQLQQACRTLEGAIRKWRGAWVEYKRLSATLHYRNVEPGAQVGLLWTARRTLSVFGRTFALRSGNLALEIRPKIEWDKGCALRMIRDRYAPGDPVICIGDDRTDESMFTANNAHPNIYVGVSGRSAAGYRARNPAEVAIFLSHLCDVRGLRRAQRVSA